MPSSLLPGSPFPLGASCVDSYAGFAGGVNFSVYSKHATGIDLLLFDSPAAPEPSAILSLDPLHHRTYHYWHAFVAGLKEGQVYAFRVRGPYEPSRGLRFDAEKVLLDPYGRCVANVPNYDRGIASLPGTTMGTSMRSVVTDTRRYDWGDDRPPRRPFHDTVIYEMHVKGFTANPNSGVPEGRRGTYLGLIEKIPYLLDLGVTAVELLPVFQFDPEEAAVGHHNYWGYAPVSFFAPHQGYSTDASEPLRALDEFRDMVKALHAAGIEVILDVVYNHTAEGSLLGPTLGLRGFANETYYLHEKGDRSRYADYSGCGNTLNANHSIVRRMILDSLRFWVQEMRVDGFRFDLASILSRDENGQPLENPPVLWDIESDPGLAGAKLIAEAWDAAGLYQVGRFVGDSWKEWNGVFRDDVRAFLRGDNGTITKIPERLLASPDIYAASGREPERSINFVTCHDGFTLNDLVSYSEKHNEENGHDNTDGTNDNRSWNCGAEGPTDDPAIEAIRNRQVKNFLALNLLSMGTPMIYMGDEVRRTQHGNNNAYCHDAEWVWFDWSLLEKHADIHRFVRRLIAWRRRHELRPRTVRSLLQVIEGHHIRLHGVKLDEPDLGETSHAIALGAWHPDAGEEIHVILNSYWEKLDFQLPPMNVGEAVPWRRIIDTSLSSPFDLCSFDEAPVIESLTYPAGPRSIVLLARKRTQQG
jgi:isoamylase